MNRGSEIGSKKWDCKDSRIEKWDWKDSRIESGFGEWDWNDSWIEIDDVARSRGLLTHVTDGRTDRHCSVTHCDDSCHVIRTLFGPSLERISQQLHSVCIVLSENVFKRTLQMLHYYCVSLNGIPQSRTSLPNKKMPIKLPIPMPLKLPMPMPIKLLMPMPMPMPMPMLMLDAEDADAEDVDADADATSEQSKSAVGNCNIEETLKKLLSKHITRRNRAFTIERHNGKDTVVVARPSSKDPNSFVGEADRSKWVDQLLPDTTYVNGMCMNLAAKHSENYKKVAEFYSLKVQKRVPTTKALAIASEVRLGDRQLQKLRQYLKLEGVFLELSPNVIDKIDQEVGIRTKTGPIFG
jgi:hypothetical protein